ncbi:MAG: asparagine synthase (glutamine-hydrolyzing) [Alphaproteobacteria bacterium]|nr:asparagine synthase (glutamine-hydrolyzing) [Alphaproteobacteria bacterium]
MCGIAGLMSSDSSPPSQAALDAMLRSIAHRGPDGEGRYARGNVLLGQKRLAIIDLATGNQPLFGPGGTAIVVNGEIYNYIELKQDGQGYDFRTYSDCELPLYTYAHEHGNFAKHLRGMYGIALDDPCVPELYLSRDPFGIKPLYYTEGTFGLAFASEAQALIRAGLVAPKILREKANELLQLQFTTGAQTIFNGIKRVLPGETLGVRNGRVHTRIRKAALPTGPSIERDDAHALRALEAVLLDSVMVHQRSDVPYGMFLSGGVDSSALLACMMRLNERPVRTFTAGFPETGVHDERAQARAVAKAAGAEHIEIEVTAEDFWRELPAIATAIDDPAADYAIIPTYMLAKTARRAVKVVLSGEGGDELFGGYGRYRSATRTWFMGGRRMRRKGILDGLGVLRDPDFRWRDGIAIAEAEAAEPGRTKLQVAQATDCADWLPHDLLLKLDRCLMAHGLEGRTPFLDPVVGNFAFCLPDRLKVHRGLGKYLLRKWLAGILPEAMPFERKRGFTVPVAEWIAARAGQLAPLVARSPGVAQLCYPDAVERLFKSVGQSQRGGIACWQLLFYALWHRMHIEGARRGLPLIETLEAA